MLTEGRWYLMDKDGFDRLTDRELELLRLAADGLKPKVIAGRVGLSERTVYTHLGNAARKLGASGPGEAAMALARREASGPFAKATETKLPIAPGIPALLDLVLPEMSGRRFNDLSMTHRIVVMMTRAALIAFTLFAIVSLVRNIGELLANAA
jgi:DNA-binding CsgD family transcriptional regulator